MADPQRFRFSIDRGGTFTDIYAEVPGEPGFRVLKLLSENPDHYPDAPTEGIRRIMEEVSGVPVPRDALDATQIEWIRMGTTLATNALLERQGARTALLITRGFRDLLQIGKQDRPKIFDLVIEKPPPLYETILEVDERVRPLGSQDIRPDRPRARGINGDFYEIEKPIDLGEIREKLNKLLEEGIEALAVVLMHAYAFPAHELEIGALAEELGFRQVSLSSETMPRIKIVDRGQTTCVDAYLTPLLRDYREGFRSGFQNREPDLFFMRSDGGLVRAEVFTGSQAILSGPAGGVVGFARTVGRQEPRRPVIGFDMGGTSTDVSRFGGEFEWVHEAELAGVHLQVPQLDIRTVAAGGGSRLFYRNGMFAVGPESSGADPGPVCYRRGGPLSLTDANLLLGRLLPDYFPQVFGPGEDQPLDLGATRAAFEELTRQIQADRPGPSPRTPEEVAYGFVQVANETMARPIREVSVSRGYDLQDHVLACFGGAGGQHACALARVLGISRIFIHRFAGILSAYGLGLADVATEKQQPAAEVLGPQTRQKLLERLDALAADALQELRRQGSFQTEVRRYLHLRYRGTDTAIMVPEPPDGDWERAFLDHHRREFGFELEKREIRVDDLRVRAVGRCQELQAVPLAAKESPTPPETDCPCYFEGGWRKTPVFRLERLGAGETIPGPAILIHPTSTLVVEPECTARITRTGDVEIDVSQEAFRRVRAEDDPVQLAVFGNRFMSIAEQMGRTLQRTAISTNIKERQDYSCAVFGPAGDLVANAPHQPVHLGAMGEAVRRQWALQGPSLEPGDVWVTNHPVEGGSHLPDITVITPEVEGNQPVFFVANRGHHAEIGGITPGSMPPFSTGLEEEGACIKSFKLVAQGIFQEQGIARILTTPSGSGPSSIPGTRALADNISDLKAQAAANQKGIQLLREMAGLYSLETVQAFMGYLQKNAEASVRAVIRKISRDRGLREVDTIEAEDYLDDGTPLRLRLTLDRKAGTAVFDFTGTGPQVPGNLNAPRAVTYSAILYCLRCLVESDIPLNQGCLNPIRVILEEGSLLAPDEHAAVAGGNVLTSQRVTDVVFKAFGVCAASQGCMNNLTFGDASFGYYETLGGGAGAGPGWHGQSGVHTHMTNTRITDPEVLEVRYPVVLREFSLRRGSGGGGRFRGGDGLVREIEFLQPLHVAVLSERRVVAPYGMDGGEPGSRGKNLFLRKDGTEKNLGGKNEIQVQPGDRLRLLTPGGGGFGRPPETG